MKAKTRLERRTVMAEAIRKHVPMPRSKDYDNAHATAVIQSCRRAFPDADIDEILDATLVANNSARSGQHHE